MRHTVLPDRDARRSGMTLLEVLVGVGVVAILSTIAALSARYAPAPPQDPVSEAMRSAIRGGTSVSLVVIHAGDSVLVTATPDGRLLGGERVGRDPLTGQVLP